MPANVPQPITSAERDPAPVFLIQNAAKDAGVQSPESVQSPLAFYPDVISTGLVALPTAMSLLELCVRYRWIPPVYTDLPDPVSIFTMAGGSGFPRTSLHQPCLRGLEHHPCFYVLSS